VVRGLVVFSGQRGLVVGGRLEGRTIDVLAQGQKALSLPSKLGESVVCGVRLRFQCHVSSVAVELPH
jgi:hypothetical protein